MPLSSQNRSRRRRSAFDIPKGLPATVPPHSAMMEHVAYLEGWIQSCNENHGDKCQADPMVDRPPHHIPDWVIDTQAGCIVRGCSVQKYAALSYAWNSASNWKAIPAIDDRLILKKDNLAEFCREGFLRSHILDKVPVVIRDAIDLVRISGFRYLWVDSLCIVQHEDTTRDRIGLMNEIYSGAYFTIIAAASTEGLCGKSYDDGQLPCESISAHHLHSKLLCSHWASRGWTFQEQLLSKRSIIFLDDLCFWDCQQEVQWPGSSMSEIKERAGEMSQFDETPRPPYISRHPLERVALERAQWRAFGRDESQDLTSLSPVPDFKLYIELVCRYNNRNFSYDQDVLPAFSGVLEVFSRHSFRGGFISGLPALFLDSALLWQPLLNGRRRSPAETATKIAPMESQALPSWSWAGWKCLVDPDSLKGGLDYMASQASFYGPDPSRTEGTSWRTEKLVDWSALSDDNSSFQSIDEPALLQSFKADWEEPSHEPLPTGWSRDISGAFIHENNPTVIYRYPLPTQDSPPSSLADTNASLLSCTTRTATLRVRRILRPFDRNRRAKARCVSYSVFKTDLYNFKPKVMTLCPVITLEDKNGRWAGAMTHMHFMDSLPTGRELKIIAISTGSALQRDVAESFPEMIDSQGFWLYGPSLHHYRYYTRGITAATHTRQSLDAGIDVGPFAYRHFSDRSNTSPAAKQTATAEINQPERYHFYNVLWVETIDGVMYRKAAGRVPKEIWELNCGEPTKIVLG